MNAQEGRPSPFTSFLPQGLLDGFVGRAMNLSLANGTIMSILIITVSAKDIQCEVAHQPHLHDHLALDNGFIGFLPLVWRRPNIQIQKAGPLAWFYAESSARFLS